MDYYLRSNSLEDDDRPVRWWERLRWWWDDYKAWRRYGDHA